MNSESAAATQRASDLAALSRAGGALWLATLSLMTAFMNTAAPAHRYLLAGRIARNFELLREQSCFDESTRATFSKMAIHWRRKAEALSPFECRRSGTLARLQRLIRH